MSSPQDYYQDFEPRRYYRLTKEGITAPDWQWSNPHRVLYPQYDELYFREKRKQHHYVQKSPTRRRNHQQYQT